MAQPPPRAPGPQCGARVCPTAWPRVWCGTVLWADEFALQTMSALAGVRLLIFDEQASSRGSRSGRARGADAAARDSRFVCVGDEPSERVLLLNRSRRQHYSPVFYHGRGVVEVSALPAATRALWPSLGGSDERLCDAADRGSGETAAAAKRPRKG